MQWFLPPRCMFQMFPVTQKKKKNGSIVHFYFLREKDDIRKNTERQEETSAMHAEDCNFHVSFLSV